MKKKYIIRPLEHMLDMSYPSLNHPMGKAEWGTKNFKISSNRISKRWGYSEDRDVGSQPYVIAKYAKYDGTTEYTVYVTEKDIGIRETGSGKTFSYKTPVYTTGTISGISGTTVTGSSTGWKTGSGNPAAGDYFIMDDDWTSDEEIDTHWKTIASITDDTHLELSGTYTKNGTGYTVRQVYSLPTGERWQYAIINDIFYFTNGSVDVQYWNGSGNASTLDSTYASNARYCLEYADRLCLADLKVSSNRSPWTLRFSKNGDPTDFTDDTAGRIDFLDTEDFIMGLGKVGPNIIVYKENSLIFGHRTGESTNPLSFPDIKKGIGCIAPYSIVEVKGTNAFLGRDDFYVIEGLQARPIGADIRYKLFDITTETNLKRIWGYNNRYENEILWFVVTSEGQYAFVWNYKENKWDIYDFADTITAIGG